MEGGSRVPCARFGAFPRRTLENRASRWLWALALMASVSGCGKGRVAVPDQEQPHASSTEEGTGTRAKGEALAATADEKALHADAPAAPAPRVQDGMRGAGRSPVRAAPPPPLAEVAKRKAGNGARGQPAASAAQGATYGALGLAAPTPAPTTAGKPGKNAPLALDKVTEEQGPNFNTENYGHNDDNPFLAVADQPLSTFSIDVDTASYSNARRFLRESQLPPKDAIRTEEWVNYFSYHDPAPAGDRPVAVHTELSDCPWNPSARLLRVGLKAKTIEEANVGPRNLVFLIDVSGSMMEPNKLPLLKRGLALLTKTLRPQDTISMVVYAGSSGLALPPTSGKDKDRILAALDALEAGGLTNGAEGIRLAYSVAEQHFVKNGINRVILATDGDFNVGTTSEGDLVRLIEEKRTSGVFLTVLGFGEGNLQDKKMELLADKGNGNYAYIDSIAEAHKVLVRQAGSTLVTVAKDVKVQVEFNPAHVARYRLVGYEDRLLAKQDFNDDTKDAGEMGAGHTVTALYELTPTTASAAGKGTTGTPKSGAAPAVDPLKYQSPLTPSAAAASPELLTVKVRYKNPTSDASVKFEEPVADAPRPLEQTSEDFRFAAAVADAALVLRGAHGVPQASMATARRLATGAIGDDPSGDRREFVALLERASQLMPAPASPKPTIAVGP